ncbi:hypothetical protein PT277_08020 [Acetobacteraceae bacterium ESL0709]|nr:hypothetical protein [Acetobacteraceae bacterium ESL0697]MDF7678626.1 hypothetical protein [Acetobacteraceae bacterium ESL0709]
MRIWTRQWQDDGSRKWVPTTGNQAIIAWIQNMLLLQRGECIRDPELGFSLSGNSYEGPYSYTAISKLEEIVSDYVASVRISRNKNSSSDGPVYDVSVLFEDGSAWSSGQDLFNQSYSQTGPYTPQK